MASAEIEATLKKIVDTQLVHARLMETNERKWNRRHEALRGRTENLERAAAHLHRATEKLWRVAETHEQRVESLEDAVRTTVASIDRLIKMLENFAKGRKRQDGRP